MSVSEGVSQAIGYCLEQGVPYIVVTNGADWHAYETHKKGPLEEKRIIEFSVTGQPTVMKALWLWRGNFEASQPVSRGCHKGKLMRNRRQMMPAMVKNDRAFH